MEVANDKNPSSSEIKKAISGGMKAVDLVMDNVESIIKPVSTVLGVAAFVAQTYGVIRKFTGIDENEYDSEGYWEMAIAGLCGGLSMYLINRTKSLIRYTEHMERLIKDAAEVGRDIKLWEMKKMEKMSYAEIMAKEAKAQKRRELAYARGVHAIRNS